MINSAIWTIGIYFNESTLWMEYMKNNRLRYLFESMKINTNNALLLQ